MKGIIDQFRISLKMRAMTLSVHYSHFARLLAFDSDPFSDIISLGPYQTNMIGSYS